MSSRDWTTPFMRSGAIEPLALSDVGSSETGCMTPVNDDRDALIAKGGHKDDAGKEPFHLLAPEFLFATASVLAHGARKYRERNWETGMDWSRVFSALMRHMWAWWAGHAPTSENFVFGHLDPDTKFSHLWHAACCIMFLVAYEERKVGTDDRPH